jgi:hypothetical protein
MGARHTKQVGADPLCISRRTRATLVSRRFMRTMLGARGCRDVTDLSPTGDKIVTTRLRLLGAAGVYPDTDQIWGTITPFSHG